MTITLTPEAEREIQAEADRQDATPEQVATQAMLAGLRGHSIPQTLAELRPLRQLAPGQTLGEALRQTPWPDDEPDLTDEELNQILEALS